LPPASTAKILTALIVLERQHLRDSVVVPAVATQTTGATVPLQAGERSSVEALLFAMLVGSANDAALALGHHSGGSIERFVASMNEKAQALGALRSKFFTPTGLPRAGQMSTAHDLALITRAALEKGDFRRIVATRRYLWKSADQERELVNSNRLLDDYAGAIGVKTGSTKEAGFCLVAAAVRGERTLIAVMLNSRERVLWREAKSLLDYGFATIRTGRLLNRPYGSIPG
jgi:D-alanyl-D-alanine carboxypeptidase (penicillin-binding protein 5/6)